LSGHGAARLIAVSTNIAASTIARPALYGRSMSSTRRDVPVDAPPAAGLGLNRGGSVAVVASGIVVSPLSP
jgi:hypothetical protein